MTAVGLAYFLTVVTMTFSVLALRAIADDFGVTLRTVGWVVIVESLIIAALLLPFGGLSDVLGRGRTLRAGVAVFGLGLALTGVVSSFPLLIAARVVTALGNTLIQAVGTGIVVAAFPDDERGFAIGAQTTAVALGAAVGPLLGGLLLDELDWQLLFILIALPTAGTLVIVSAALGPEVESGRNGEQPFDWAGAVLAASFIVVFVVTLSDPFEQGLGGAAAVGAIATVGLLIGFVRTELRQESPMLDVRLFGFGDVRRAVTLRVLAFVSSTAVLFLIPIYLLGLREIATRQAGLIVALSAIGMTVGAQISGRLYDRLGPRLPLMIGLTIQIVVLLVLAGVDGSSSLAVLGATSLGNGLGLGLWIVPANSVIMGTIPPEVFGVGGAVTNVTRTVGNVIGQAGATAIVAGVMAAQDFDIPLGEIADTPGAGEAFIEGWRATFVAAALVSALALVIAARLPGRRPARTSELGAGAPTAGNSGSAPSL